jgi:hypothetical protein
MLDRQKIEAILSRRFPGSRHDQVAAAANAIMGLADEWEEVPRYSDLGYLAQEVENGAELLIFKRREG